MSELREQHKSIWLASAAPSDARAVSVIHSGFLSKKGERNMFSWKNRFFTLKSNGDLIYYENTSSTQSLGTIPISTNAICTADPKSPLHFSIQAAGQSRKYCMKAENADECSAWFSKISDFISLKKKEQSTRRQSRSVLDVDDHSASSSPTVSALASSLSAARISELDEEEEEEMELDGSDALAHYERELNATGATAVSRGRLHIRLHATRRSATYWFELLHGSKVLNYYSSNSNHRSSFVNSTSLHCAAVLTSSSDPNSLIISHGGARQSAPIHHVITAPSPSALSFWLDAFATVVDNCLSREAVESRRRKAEILHRLDEMRQQRPSLQLIGASLQDFSNPPSSSSSSSSIALSQSVPQQSMATSVQPPLSSSSSLPMLFTEEGDGGEAFRDCTAQLLQLRREPMQARCVILDRFTRAASAPHDARLNADAVMYNPPVLALLTVGGVSNSVSSNGGIGKDGFRMSLVDDLSNVRFSEASTAPVDSGSGSGGGSGVAAVEVDDDKDDGSGGENFVFSISACSEVHVAFDADYTEEWLPVTVHMLQLDLASARAANAYSKVEVEQLVVFHCRMVGHDVGELLQVLDERAREFNPFIAQAAQLAASSVKSTRSVFDVCCDSHVELLRRIWASAMKEKPFPGHEHPDWELEIGFQGKQPSTDLRKMGVFALEQIAYFAEHYTERFDGMRRFGDDCLFPASSVSVNISDLVLSLLNCSIGPVQQATSSKAMATGSSPATAMDVGASVATLTDITPIPKSFLLIVIGKLLQGGVKNPLHELHSACMIRFSLIMEEGNYKYMDISSQVLPLLRQSFLQLISTFPKNVFQLQSWAVLGADMLLGSASFQNIATGLMHSILKAD